MVEDINQWFSAIDGIIYFDAISGNFGREMWAHDPIDGSTWQIADINKGCITVASQD